MIAWKAKYGYCTNATEWASKNIVWTDDSFWTFPTSFTGGNDFTNVEWPSSNISNYKNSANADYFVSSFGQDYYTISFMLTKAAGPTQEKQRDLFINMFASARTVCPNLYDFLLSNRTGFSVCYIPGLKRYIRAHTDASPFSIQIFDENFNLIRDNRPQIPNLANWNQSFSWIMVYVGSDTNIENVGDMRNWKSVNLYMDFSNSRVLFYTSNYTETTYNMVLSALFGEYNPPDYTGNPFDPIDPSQPGGGGGTFDDSSDLIPDSSLPTLSSANTGFTRIYNPTLSQVQQLAQYLWTDETLIETLWNKVKQYFEDPMQAIIGFNLVPVPVPDAGTKNFALMYIDTGVSMNVAASQFVDRDCGTLKIEPYYGSALDYAPHTKISIFLPFIGTVQLNTDEVMGRTLQVKYRIDICSGSCVAKVAVDGNFIYQFSGHCAIPIPISSSDFSSYVGSAISVAKLGITAAVGAATGGAGLFASAAAQQTGNAVSTMTETTTARNPDTGRQITTGTRTVEVSTPVQSTGASFSGISPQNVSNTVGEIMASKPFVEHSGSFSGNTGYLGIRRPFLIIERPNLCLPENFQNYNGYPSMITLPLSECTGFTAVQQIHLEGVTATNPEQAEILELLKGGVIF